MPSQDKMPEGRPPSTVSAGNPALADVARQLEPEQENPTSAKPQVVFIGKKSSQRIVEISIAPRDNGDEIAEILNETSLSDPSLRQAAHGDVVSAPVDGNSVAPPTEFQFRVPHVHGLNAVESEGSDGQPSRFTFDPFALEIDGPIPVMPTLPIVEAIEMTQKVVSREKAGDHYAWRLKPGPYPDVGNTPQVDSEEDSALPNSQQKSTEAQLDSSGDVSPDSRVTEGQASAEWTEESQWSNLEVVSDSNFESLGDNFIVQPGEVISIDGNQGYDHIDLRSYSIEDATFHPGTILLSSDMLAVSENEETPAPISIRHRGVAFAIFKGEIRVEL